MHKLILSLFLNVSVVLLLQLTALNHLQNASTSSAARITAACLPLVERWWTPPPRLCLGVQRPTHQFVVPPA